MPLRQYLSVLILIASSFLVGCVLDRDGTCGEGDLVCSVHTREFRFTTEANSYHFAGQCWIRKEDGSSRIGDPMFRFTSKGEWERASKEFAEVVKVEGAHNENLAITGFSPVDPWLNPSLPVGISAMAGDPQAIARNLCLSQLPQEYWRIPFSRNVMVHMLSLTELATLKGKAANPEQPPDNAPPPPPCVPAWITGPPEVDMPKPGLVYKEDVQGITAYMRSRCGADNVEYGASFYQVFFERRVDTNWVKFRGYKVAMQYAASGGSLGSDTLPLDGPGLWRMQARHVIQQKHKTAATTGEFSDWVEFWVGEPTMNIAAIDTSRIKTMSLTDQRISNVERRWQAGPAEPIPATDKEPGARQFAAHDRLTLRTRPRAVTTAPSGIMQQLGIPAVDLGGLEITNTPEHGGFTDLRVTLNNKGVAGVPAGDYSLGLACTKVPANGKCEYRVDSILVPALKGRENWQHDIREAINLSGTGKFEITATLSGDKKKPVSRSVTVSVKPVARPAGKQPGGMTYK